MYKLFFTLLIGIFGLLNPVASWAQTSYDEWVAASYDMLDADSTRQAAECLKKAMRLEPANPQNGMLFTNLGTLQRELGELTDAEMSYSCAIALLPDASVPLLARAQLYAQMEKYADAIGDYSRLLEKDPENEDVLYERALCRLMSTDTIGARRDLEYIDTFNPKSAKSRLGMAIVYKATGEYSMAIDLYNALIKANPKSWSLLRDRAEVHFLSNRMGAALLDVNASLDLNPNDPFTYMLRAQIRLAKGDKDYARRDINTALEKGIEPQIVVGLLEKMQ
ncbi:MAG: tetratricopeptide repeat protein [Bacteroidales bacterium]|nr:tetratricopeptide repeat protein [Bacteroidales bacterium]